MKGLFGAGLIAVGIFAAIMGGYLLNAETVPSCETDWTYVTDVSGAFRGDRSDMDVDYSPSSNVTGWSWERGFNNGWISGVDYAQLEPGKVNAYGAYSGEAGYVTMSMTLTSQQTSGTEPSVQYTAESGGTAYLLDQPSGWGISNPEAVTILKHGGSDVAGAFAARLSDVVSAIPGYSDYATVELTMQNVSDGYPLVGAVDTEYTNGPAYTAGGSTYYNIVRINQAAFAHETSATILCKESAAVVGDRRIPLSEALIVWGHAKFNNTGTASASCSISMVALTADGGRIYVDPAAGVAAVPGTYTTNALTATDHSGSSTASVELSFEHPYNYSESLISGTLSSAMVGQGSSQFMSWSFAGGSNGGTIVSVTVNGTMYSANTSNYMAVISVSVASGDATVYLNGSVVATEPIDTPIESFGLSASGTSVPHTQYDFTNANGDTVSRSGTGSWTVPMSYRTYAAVPTTHSYDTGWWCNRYDNSAVTMAFASSSTSLAVTDISVYGSGVSSSLLVTHSASGWGVELDGTAANIGSWPAIQVTINAAGLEVLPISSFVSFIDYAVLNVPTRVSSPLGGETITDMEVDGTAAMRMAVVYTTTRITEGGLYLQDAQLDLQAAFPGVNGLTITIGSAARTGTGITISSGLNSVTLPVDGTKIQIDGVWQDLNGVSFRWYSPSAPTVSAGGQLFTPKIYYRGQTYDSGSVWAETSGGKMTEILEAPSAFEMTLDGVWAPATFLYTGDNEAAERTELADFSHGEYRWDKNDFVLIMMAVSLVGGIVGSYFRITSPFDWLIIIGTIGTLWLIL